ncbi:MAG: PIN domain-containing protein [Bacteroidia bacterium]|nr:MAG: PIN domain-containing protein [Bacteroidia bacterium]
MILIDTSVWIEFFKQKEVFVQVIQPLLRNQKVVTIEPIFSELLFGVRNSRERKIIESYWRVLPRIEYAENSMIHAAIFANGKDYHKLGIGLMDAIIIKSAMDGNHQIWTLDARINRNLAQNHVYQSGKVQ